MSGETQLASSSKPRGLPLRQFPYAVPKGSRNGRRMGEVMRAVRKLAQDESDLYCLTEKQLSAALDTGGLPDPDLIIRTAGERRLSNFLPWQRVYSEILTWPQEWPEICLGSVLCDTA